MIGWNWKKSRNTNIFDIFDCVSDKISFLISEIRFRFKPRKKTPIITLTRDPQKYCPIDRDHAWRHEVPDSFYCLQCGHHYERNEMSELTDTTDWQVPPKHIPVALAGAKEADWTLEENERKQ